VFNGQHRWYRNTISKPDTIKAEQRLGCGRVGKTEKLKAVSAETAFNIGWRYPKSTTNHIVSETD
jgi:hypothetical protein